MIELKFTGYCEGCTYANIMTSCDYADTLIIHTSVDCSHAEVCDMWQDRMEQALRIEALSVQPEKGHWLVKQDHNGSTYGECSQCHSIQYAGHTPYCPYCGSKMEDKQ